MDTVIITIEPNYRLHFTFAALLTDHLLTIPLFSFLHHLWWTWLMNDSFHLTASLLFVLWVKTKISLIYFTSSPLSPSFLCMHMFREGNLIFREKWRGKRKWMGKNIWKSKRMIYASIPLWQLNINYYTSYYNFDGEGKVLIHNCP